MEKDSYIVIHSWMTQKLKLKDKELLIFAIIHSFTESKGFFDGSLRYIEKFTLSSKKSVIRNIQSLQEKGFVIKIKRGNGQTNILMSNTKIIRKIVENKHSNKTESPIEEMLYEEMEKIKQSDLLKKGIIYFDVIPQARVKINGNNYRLDFLVDACCENSGRILLVVECDGHEFHERTKAQVKNDNKRQRNLQSNGYIVVRFSGSEIYEDPKYCCNQLIDIISSHACVNESNIDLI